VPHRSTFVAAGADALAPPLPFPFPLPAPAVPAAANTERAPNSARDMDVVMRRPVMPATFGNDTTSLEAACETFETPRVELGVLYEVSRRRVVTRAGGTASGSVEA
jgi:hypothetical protein